MAEKLARRAADREVEARRAAHVEEMERIVEAAYRVVERSGDVDPKLRDVLRAAGLSTQAFYRHFLSKDELLLVLLDDGRRRLVGYLEHRVAKARSPQHKVRAWIEGVLAQASDEAAAARTRPFVAGQDRIAEQFPDEQQASVDRLVDVLATVLEDAAPDATRRRRARAVYHLAFGVLHRHLTYRTTPSAAEADHLVRFALRGASLE
jgi:AcrR family transcriptional regulator